jgi:hypothetical protein
MGDPERTGTWEFRGPEIWALENTGGTDGGVRPDPNPEPVSAQGPDSTTLYNIRDRIHNHPVHSLGRICSD